MKRRLSLLLIFALLCVCLLPMLTSCTPGTEYFTLSLSDASGAGTLVTTVLFSLAEKADNGAYVKNAQKLAEGLQAQADALTRTKDVYHVAYAGKQGENDAITLSFSFTDINDYNAKALRLYHSASESTRNALYRTDAFPLASWTCENAGDGTYNATFSQNGAAFVFMNQWAYDYLMKHDIEGAWDFTGAGNAVQYNPLGDNTFILSENSPVALTVGDSKQIVPLFKGKAPQTVTVTGKVSGTAVAVDENVSDESLIVSDPVKEKAPSYPALNEEAQKTFDALQKISLSLPTDRAVKVACVGDSITHGTEGEERTYPSYPWFLQQILGDGFDVRNFGVGGTRLMHSDGNGAAYTNCAMYQPGLDFAPDVVIIMLGTNDSSAYSFKRFDQYFASDYQELVNTYKNLPSHPYVIVATSPYAPAVSGTNDAIINDYIVPYERELFTKLENIDGVVDVEAWSHGRYYLYFDNVHYSAEGYYSLALHYAESIFGIRNGYRTVTVKTSPNANVQLARPVENGNVFTQNVVADESGVAVLHEQDGTYTVTIRATDCATYTGELNISGDATVDLPLSPGDHNVALYRPVTASSTDNSAHSAEMVNDEECGTNWHPLDGDSARTLVFDLGESKELHGIRVSSRFQSYASAYTVEVSDDGETFTLAASCTDERTRFVNDHLAEHTFDSVHGRFVRVKFTKMGYLFNCEIFDLQLLSNDERTVSQRELDVIEARKKAAEEPETPKKSLPWWPFAAGGAVLAAAAAAVAIILKKKHS